MEITKNALENLMITYAEHKKAMIEYEKDYDSACDRFYGESDKEYENNPEYMFHKGCCETAEDWMRSIGVSPQCNFIMDRLK